MFSPFSSTVHLHSKKKNFQYMRLLCVATKYLLQLLFLYTSVIICSFVDSVGSFFGCYDVEKRIDHSRKLLDLEGNMLMSVMRKLL